MGGAIGVESEPGRGSTFWVTVPFARADDQVPSPPLSTDLRGLRVLIVDDNATSRAILQEQLGGWDVVSHGAADGAAALAMLRAAAGKGRPYDVALVDAQMPRMDGRELVRAIAADPALAATALVLLTAPGQAPEPKLGTRAVAYLVKPVRQSQLFDSLAAVVHAAEPAAGAPAPVPASLPASAAPARPSGPCVLVAEDSRINQQVACGVLERLGYRAEVANNGLEALDALGRGAYAAVLMDCQMPSIDGYTATVEIRRREGQARRTPIIGLTASAMKGDRERCLAAGMDDYIAKPFRADELAAALERWVTAAPPANDAPRAGHRVGQPRTATSAAVDTARLRRLEPALLAEMVDLFGEDTPARLAALRQALSASAWAELRAVAHLLKGEASTIGARELQHLCRDLERAAEDGSQADATAVIEAIGAAFRRAQAELEEERFSRCGS